jgi:nitrogen fixation protein FixH
MARGMTLEQRSPWRFFPAYLILALFVVILVNIGFVVIAEKTFPGEINDNPYGIGNGYNKVLDDVARQQALGWIIGARTEEGLVIVTARAKDGTMLPAQVTAVAVRPLGDPKRTALYFSQAQDGSFQGQEALSPGQWDVMLTIHAQQTVYRATKRLVVR